MAKCIYQILIFGLCATIFGVLSYGQCNPIHIRPSRSLHHWCQRHDGMRCPTNLEPACGSDGVTYKNRCFLQCISDIKRVQSQQIITLVKWGHCKDSDIGSKFEHEVHDIIVIKSAGEELPLCRLEGSKSKSKSD